MEELAKELSVYLLERLKHITISDRVCVGISGVPGAGKTTFAAKIQSNVNKLWQLESSDMEVEDVATVVPLDGWHLTRDTLATFPDPTLARDRRGAHWTFNANGYVSFVERLRKPISTENVTAPSFSHSLKDPVEDDIVVRPHHRIVLIEGLYVFLSTDPWNKAGESLDERWFITVDPALGKERLCQRHVETGVANNWAEATWRAVNNDIPNGQFILENMLTPHKVIDNNIIDASVA